MTWLESVKKRPAVVRGEGMTHWYGVDVSPEERDLLVAIAEAAQEWKAADDAIRGAASAEEIMHARAARNLLRSLLEQQS